MFKEKEIVMVQHGNRCDAFSGIVLNRNNKGRSFLQLGFNSSDKHYSYAQHLYILSDEPINVGDCIYETTLGIVGRRVGENGLNKDTRKIIATTDGSLGLPLIHNDFVKDYMRSWNNGVKIDKIVVNYCSRSKRRGFPKYNEESVYKEYFYETKNNYICISLPNIKPTQDIKTRLFTEDQIMNALHQVELKHSKDYSKIWNELKQNLK